MQAYGISDAAVSSAIPRQVKQRTGDEDTIVLNVDGSALTNPGQAGFGGIMHNQAGEFLGGYYGSVEVSNILHAEVMALYHGINLCWE